MRFDYLLYPEGLEKIKQSGIEERVQKLKDSEEGLPYIGRHVSFFEIEDIISDLKEQGYYKNISEDFSKTYKTIMNDMFKDFDKHKWIVNRPEGAISEKIQIEDFLLFSGDLASIVLKPEELWSYKDFGFDSSTNFILTAGLYVLKESQGHSLREGYMWTTKKSDGSQIVTEITGDFNADLRIFQKDVAPYITLDPFGNQVSLRPELDADRHILAAYHSTEGHMLVAVMKYIEQQNINANYKKDNAKELIDWGRSLGQSGGSCTEYFGGFYTHPMMFFPSFSFPIPRLNEKNETDKYSPFYISCESEGHYSTYISHKDELVFSYEKFGGKNQPRKKISAIFLPEDAEHLVKGLIYQSAKGLGRTSARQLFNILEYRYSEQFEKDQK
ncbi:MAG: hypothetical protein ACOC1K_03890 [Nanoarchaeota archaeon]